MLRILRTILRSSDVTLVEESVPAFEALAAHQDPAVLAADSEYMQRYEEVVQLYAQFAAQQVVAQGKMHVSWPVAIRFRKAGLRALRAVASAESLAAETARQLSIVVSPVLVNLYADDGCHLTGLERCEQAKEAKEKDQSIRRRQSISTVRTAETADGDAVAAAGTTEDADKMAEEEVGLLALQALRNLFAGVTRGQLRLATNAVLEFVGRQTKLEQGNSWPHTLLVTICEWASVQDRYIILVGAVESLTRSPIVESDLGRQLVLATVIDSVLHSSINFIGLSVMDVLLGLISHALLLLQGGPSPTSRQRASVLSTAEKSSNGANGANGFSTDAAPAKELSPSRPQLLATLQRCVATLATHVYYADQISDMVSTLLVRLKPSAGASTTAADDAAAALPSITSSASLHERSHASKFFSSEAGRSTALGTVKDILLAASGQRSRSCAAVSRNAVGLRVWEGTHWLLRDPSAKVRWAYVDALATYLTLETNKKNLRVTEDPKRSHDKMRSTRRAVSSASHRDKSPRRTKDTFLSLLHLAVYENAHQYSDSQSDLLLLHLLLVTLVEKLGVNAVRHGLPMIFRLQEDIQNLKDPAAKLLVGGLVHGYLWSLSNALEFDKSPVGRSIHAEIQRGMDEGLWAKAFSVPPMPLDCIELPLTRRQRLRLSAEIVQTKAVKPFDNREALVDKIADGYASAVYSPPSSPPASPGTPGVRSVSLPILAKGSLAPSSELPSQVKAELRAEWSKESCVASHTKESAASLSGSRTAHSGYRNNYLGVTIPNGDLDSAIHSPIPTPRRSQSRSRSAFGLVGRLHSPHRHRSPSGTPNSTSSLRSTVRVNDLKRVLSGASAPRTSYSVRPFSQRQRHAHVDTASDQMPVPSSTTDSLVSADFSVSDDASFVTAERPTPVPPATATSAITTASPSSPSGAGRQSPTATPAASATPRPLASPSSSRSRSHSPSPARSPNTHAVRERELALAAATNDVPPVPPIPANLRDTSVSPVPRPVTAPSAPMSPPASASGLANGVALAPAERKKPARSPRRSSLGAKSVGDVGTAPSPGLAAPSPAPRRDKLDGSAASDKGRERDRRKARDKKGPVAAGALDLRGLLDEIDVGPTSPRSWRRRRRRARTHWRRAAALLSCSGTLCLRPRERVWQRGSFRWLTVPSRSPMRVVSSPWASCPSLGRCTLM